MKIDDDGNDERKTEWTNDEVTMRENGEKKKMVKTK